MVVGPNVSHHGEHVTLCVVTVVPVEPSICQLVATLVEPTEHRDIGRPGGMHDSKTASLAQPAAIMMQVLVMTYEEEDEEDEEDTAPTW